MTIEEKRCSVKSINYTDSVKNKDDLTITKYHNCLVVSDIIDGFIVIKRYIGYTEKEAVNSFISEFKDVDMEYYESFDWFWDKH